MSFLRFGEFKATSYLNSKASHPFDIERFSLDGRLDKFFRESLRDVAHLRVQRMTLYFTEHEEARRELEGRIKEYEERTGRSGWFPSLFIAKKFYSEILERLHDSRV